MGAQAKNYKQGKDFIRMKPDLIFETSWEVCNQIGGIYTVISTKAKSMVEEFGDKYVLIGPDVWKETKANPDFIEDKNLLGDWQDVASKQGLKVKVGRWNIKSKPLVVLVGFTHLYAQKDEIFTHLWNEFNLDSLSGQWDYIEPAIFGYAAGQVIESFYKFFSSTHQNVVAQFHEWMTGTGILYLKENLPFVGTAFTTHATVLGRSIAGNGYPLYENIGKYEPMAMAEKFWVISKHSLETLSARQSDVFTTVSKITSAECLQFLKKPADILTLNGFDNSFVPSENDFPKIRAKARQRILEVAAKITGKLLPEDTFMILNSGRYEFRNKGIDLFIKALGKLNGDKTLKKPILAVIAVPAGHDGLTSSFSSNIMDRSSLENRYVTHKLNDYQNDPILREADNNKLENTPEDQVHLIFIPAYLNGNDGVVNLAYYDFITAFDYTVFPSYYEPWGYTPMESIAFGIPTITTSYAGFGTWVLDNLKQIHCAIHVVDRKDKTDDQVTRFIASRIKKYIEEGNVEETRKEAREISKMLLWDNLKKNYLESWEKAGKIANERKEVQKPQWTIPETLLTETTVSGDTPVWKRIIVEPDLPGPLEPLKELAFNLWWSWDSEAQELFKEIDPKKWKEVEYNPVMLLESLYLEDITRLAKNKDFITKLNKIYARFREYIETPKNKEDDLVAYFSMEYGLHSSIKTYSGGLGILAGDYLKQASDSNKNIIAIGLMYRQGYFKQSISHLGDQIAEYTIQQTNQLPLESVKDEKGNSIRVAIALPGRVVWAKAWRLNVGRIPLYLLDTNINDNNEQDRKLSAQLYGGDNEHRLKQEILLGIGGIRLIQKLNLNPAIYHSNEGHSAFIGLERIDNLIQQEQLTFQEALEYVRATTLFTTHTPVPAGHDSFEEHLIRAYLSHFTDHFSISWEDFIGLGRFRPKDSSEKFSMSVLATKLSREVNGVSRIHGRVSRNMFKGLYPGFYEEELHIGYVTNGVHYYTWTNSVWQKLYHDTFDEKFEHNQSNPRMWENIYDISDEKIWKTRQVVKRELITYVKECIHHDLTDRQENPKLILESLKYIHDKCLIFGFARRFATYKRAHLLFTDTERLARIVNNPERPVIIIFAGKAHPQDKAGQDLIKSIIEISKREEFVGRILFLEDYDMTMGKMLTNGVDVWLNTPTRPLEASGTSGEKATLNGVLNFSVLDGWWAEGYKPNSGWAVTETRTYESQELQDQLDAEVIYNMMETEIIPAFFNQDENGVSQEWASRIKNTLTEIAPHFTMERMLKDYEEKFYKSLFESSKLMKEGHYRKTRELVLWKQKVSQFWDNISVVSVSVPDTRKGPIPFGKLFSAEIILDLIGLHPEDIDIEIIMGKKEEGNINKILMKQPLELKKVDGSKASFVCKFPISYSGKINYAFRMTPRNEMLIHKMDFPLVKWF